MLARVTGVRVLLTEGSSLTSREVVTCLGPVGYHLEVLDPDPLCLARFSRWVDKVHRCPRAGADPMSYLRTLERVASQRGIDVVLPTHEHAWLLATARPQLAVGRARRSGGCIRLRASPEQGGVRRVARPTRAATTGLAHGGFSGRPRGPVIPLLAQGSIQHGRPRRP